MKALVLAGGRGQNMAPFSDTRPKPTLFLGDSTVIDHTFSQLKKAGVNLAHVVAGHESEKLIVNLDENHQSGVAVHTVKQNKPGIGNAILSAKDRFSEGEHFLLVYADTFTTGNIFSTTIQTFGLHNETTAAICHTKSSENYGNVYLSPEAKITKMIEKPPKEENLHNYVLAGVFVVSTSLFKHLEENNADMVKALGAMIENEGVRAAIWEDDWIDLAYPWDILAANHLAMNSWSEAIVDQSVKIQNAHLQGALHIEKGVTISSGALIEGPAFIGEGAFIGHNVLVRPYTCIGANCVIGQGSEIKNSVICNSANIGSSSIISDSVIGENVEMGAGCVTVNHNVDHASVCVANNDNIDTGLSKVGAFIGDNALIGAANIFSAGSIVSAGASIDHNVSVR